MIRLTKYIQLPLKYIVLVKRQAQVWGVLAASSNTVKSWLGSGLKCKAENLSPMSSPSLLESDGYQKWVFSSSFSCLPEELKWRSGPNTHIQVAGSEGLADFTLENEGLNNEKVDWSLLESQHSLQNAYSSWKEVKDTQELASSSGPSRLSVVQAGSSSHSAPACRSASWTCCSWTQHPREHRCASQYQWWRTAWRYTLCKIRNYH